MFDYLQQFNNLPKDVRDKVASPAAMAVIAELEAKYKVDLAIVVMKLMVKSLTFFDLAVYLKDELAMIPEDAEKLIIDLKEKLFASLPEYLAAKPEVKAFDIDRDIAFIIKDSGVSLPSAVAINRFKNIVSTYARGIRGKIDTRNSLSKDVKIGGLNLDPLEIDRVIKAVDQHITKGAQSEDRVAPPASANLEATVASVEKPKAPVAAEYNLKQALAVGETKSIRPIKLDTEHEISAPEAQLDLPKPDMAASKPAVAAPIKNEDEFEELVIMSSPVGKPVSAPIAPVAITPTIPTPTPIATPTIKKEVKSVSPLSRPASHLEPIKPGAAKLPVQPPLENNIKPKVMAPRVAPLAASIPAIPTGPTTVGVKPSPVSVTAARSMAGSQTAAPASARPMMHDIKPVPKVMGPIEELQFLDVVNFRRLGTTPAEITAKVFSKIKLLEKDGYDKMVAGVKAWRQSPVCRLYLRLGQDAIAQGKPLKEVAEARKMSAQEYLSMDEIEAIVSLNGKLVF